MTIRNGKNLQCQRVGFQPSMITDNFVKHQGSWKKPNALLFTRQVVFTCQATASAPFSFCQVLTEAATGFEGQLLRFLLHGLTNPSCFGFKLIYGALSDQHKAEKLKIKSTAILCHFHRHITSFISIPTMLVITPSSPMFSSSFHCSLLSRYLITW